MPKLSNFFLHAFISAALFYGAVLTYEKFEASEYKECGEIIHMKTGFDIVTHRVKSRHYDELKNVNIIIMNYGGDIVSEEVSDNVYYRHKTGDRICFTKHDEDWNTLTVLIIMSFLIFTIITLVKLYNLIFV